MPASCKENTFCVFSTVFWIRIWCFLLLISCVIACGQSVDAQFQNALGNNYLWEQYKRSANSPEQLHEVIIQMLSAYRANEQTEYIVPFLFKHMTTFPDTPYRSYYDYLIAYNYIQKEQYDLAMLYARRALESKLVVEGISIREESASMLVRFSDRPWEQVGALRILSQSDANRHEDLIDLLYETAQTYNSIGRWTEMYQVYLQFLSLEQDIESNRYKQVLHWVSRYNSDRSWTFESLNELVQNIQSAITQKSTSRLLRYRAKDSFFTMSLNQELFDEHSSIRTFNITPFLNRSVVRYASTIDSRSNEQEAFLRTWGWSYRIPTWYLYFRKIDFPSDSSIHGHWEWAGIFFGDTL